MDVQTPAPTRRALLAEAPFRRWYAARMISLVGSSGSVVALPLLVWAATASPAATAAVAGLGVAPYLVFGLVAGAHADRVDRKRLMVGADVAAACLLATMPIAALAGELTIAQVLVVCFLAGSCFVWFDAAAFGALPGLVGKDRLPQANSLIFSTSTVIGIAVPALAALVAAVVSPVAVLAADALARACSALLLRGLHLPEREPQARKSIGADIAEGLRFIWDQRVIRTLTFAGFALAFSGGGALALLVVHADRVLGVLADDGRLGLLYSAAACGSFLGAILLPRLGRRLGHGRVSIAAYAVVAAALPLLAVNPLLASALLLWLVWDLGYTVAITNGITVRQLLTPDALQGRVNTTGRMIAWGGSPVGALAAGVLAQTVGVESTYLLLAVPVAAAAVALLCSPVRRFRR